MPDYMTTTGKVIVSEVATSQGISMEGNVMVDRYFPNVVYQYTVDGIEYENDRFYDEEIKINKVEKIQEVVARYPVGMNVPVYYNPNNPPDSYLQSLSTGSSTSASRMLIVIAASILVLIAVVTVNVLSSGANF